MKYPYFITLFLMLALVSCQDDFDEIQDSNQRRITFTFDPSHFFDDILTENDGKYSMGAPGRLDNGRLLRITSYCYDASDSLLQYHTLLCENLSMSSQTFYHLDKSTSYRFLFIADVVQADPDVGYYESWFQMDTRNWESFYSFSDSRSMKPQYDVMYTATLRAKPANQSVAVQLQSLTYNGYFVLTNTDKVDRITGYAMYVNAFMMSSKSWQRRASLAYKFSYYHPTVTTIIQPLNLCYADSVVSVKVKSTTVSGTDSITVNVSNESRRPFVITIDCEALQMETCKFY